MTETNEQNATIRRHDSSRSARIETYFSSHDGGWYSEVVSTLTGQTLHETDMHPTLDAAVAAALKWCDPIGLS